MPLSDALRFLRQGIGRQLVRWCVLPFTGPVGRFTVLLRRDHLVLATEAEPGQHELVDLAALRLRPGLPRASAEFGFGTRPPFALG